MNQKGRDGIHQELPMSRINWKEGVDYPPLDSIINPTARRQGKEGLSSVKAEFHNIFERTFMSQESDQSEKQDVTEESKTRACSLTRNKLSFDMKIPSDHLSSSGYHSSSQDQSSFAATNTEKCSTPTQLSGDMALSPDSPSQQKNKSIQKSISLNNFSNTLRLVQPWKVYCRILPKTKKCMETKLCDFLSAYNKKYFDSLNMDPCEKFSALQVSQICRSLYIKSLSLNHDFTSKYLEDVSYRVEQLLEETDGKCTERIIILYDMILKLHIIIGPTIRLLKCIETGNGNLDKIIWYEEDKVRTENRDLGIASYIRECLGETDRVASKSETSQKLNVSRTGLLPTIAVKMMRKNLKNESPQRASPQSSLRSGEFQEVSKYWKPRESDFKTLKLISQGAFGAVFLAKHVATNKRYAMKKISKGHALMKNQVRQIFAERDILSFTDNPFIVSMVCSFETKSHYCMVMEYVSGGDCASLLNKCQTFPVEMARGYIAETLLAVEYIHSYGIIHRDIKPDNLLITYDGHIKLTDFGLSKIGMINVTTQITEEYVGEFHDMQVQGTPDYIAPEVILNKPYGKAVDYWAIGVVLYHFLIGATPFYGDSVDEIFHSITSGNVEFPEEDEALPEAAQDLITKLLDLNPNFRLGSKGSIEMKTHFFFVHVDWDNLLRIKAQFIPKLSGDDDTSYFELRTERYKNNLITDEITDENNLEQLTKDRAPSGKFISYTRHFKNDILSCRKNINSNSCLSFSPNNAVFGSDFVSTSNVNVSRIRASYERNVKQSLPKTSSLPSGVSIASKKIVNYRSPLERILRKNRDLCERENVKGDDVNDGAPLPAVAETPKTVVPHVCFPGEKTIELNLNLSNKSLGFSIKTIRVNTEDEAHFVLEHLIDGVKTDVVVGSDEAKSIQKGWVITSVNGKEVDNFVHAKITHILCSFRGPIRITASSLDSLGIYVKPHRWCSRYYFSQSSPHLQKLQQSGNIMSLETSKADCGNESPNNSVVESYCQESPSDSSVSSANSSFVSTQSTHLFCIPTGGSADHSMGLNPTSSVAKVVTTNSLRVFSRDSIKPAGKASANSHVHAIPDTRTTATSCTSKRTSMFATDECSSSSSTPSQQQLPLYETSKPSMTPCSHNRSGSTGTEIVRSTSASPLSGVKDAAFCPLLTSQVGIDKCVSGNRQSTRLNTSASPRIKEIFKQLRNKIQHNS